GPVHVSPVHHKVCQFILWLKKTLVPSSLEAGLVSGPDQSHSITLLYNLSILKDKVQEAKSLVSILIPPDQAQPESTSLAISQPPNFSDICVGNIVQEKGQSFYSNAETISWYDDHCNNYRNHNNGNNRNRSLRVSNDDKLERKEFVELPRRNETSEGCETVSAKNYDKIELD
ncbi:hypothetical protein Gohar_003223, partial [Gossypium harknessii]|nr:hypothetical protein [Gossypium harknessii]